LWIRERAPIVCFCPAIRRGDAALGSGALGSRSYGLLWIRAGIIGSCVKPIRTDFTGYEGKYVAIDARTGKVVIADSDPRVVLEKAKGRNHVVVRGRVPLADEPLYVGLG
jgi:hypothetical protein